MVDLQFKAAKEAFAESIENARALASVKDPQQYATLKDTIGKPRIEKATAYAKEKFGGDEAKVKEFVTKIFDNVPVFDTVGRAATTTFVEREIGDVIITFEAETKAIAKQYGADKFEQVVPSVSLLAEFPVAVVDKVAEKHGSQELAKSYLDFLYSPEGQTIAAEFGHRVLDEKVAATFKDQFPEIRLVKVEDVFGGWAEVSKEHFAEGGVLDTIYGSR